MVPIAQLSRGGKILLPKSSRRGVPIYVLQFLRFQENIERFSEIVEREREMASAKEGSENSFLAYSAEWLQGFGARIPDASLLQAGHGFYDSLITHCISVDHSDRGRVICSMRVPANLCNAADRLHGGAITSLVDIIGSAAIFSMGVPYSGVSVEINVTFMAGAPLGEEIEIEAKSLRVGKSLAFVVVDIRLKTTGKLVAQGRHTKFLGSSGTNVVSHSRL